MKNRPAAEIQFASKTAQEVRRARIIPKPSKYVKTRYWVALPATAGRKERWLLVPNVEKAMEHISQWLLAQVKHCFDMEAVPPQSTNPSTTQGELLDTRRINQPSRPESALETGALPSITCDSRAKEKIFQTDTNSKQRI